MSTSYFRNATSNKLFQTGNSDNREYYRHRLTSIEKNEKRSNTIQLERVHVKDRYNKAILVENNILPINDYEEKLRMKSAHNSNKNKKESKQKKKSIIKLDPKTILREGPSFSSLHSWSHYLNAFIYDHGIPRQVGAINYHYDNGSNGVYVGYRYEPPDISRWETNETLWDRNGRFPSVEDRIKYYMGERWYDMEPNSRLFKNIDTSCTNTSRDLLTPEFFHTIFASPFDLSPEKLFRIAFYKPSKKNKKKPIPLQRNAQYYTRDIIDLAILHNKSSTPVLMHFGDGPSKANSCFDLNFPVFSKVRDLVAENDAQRCRYYSKSGNCHKHVHSNIIWPMNRGRHFRPVASVPLFDVPWKKKKAKLVWRGRALCDESNTSIHSVDFFSCEQRMALVRNHLDSKLVDAKFHMPRKAKPKDIPETYFGDKLDMEGMLRYKYQLAVEGTDISSGLKWMLFSNSVVFMPTPTYSSYAMETLLQPFVHYIPIHANMSNVEDMVMWCENHPEEAMHIAQRSTLFMYDLFFHPDAYQDEQDILTGIMKRYKELFSI